jgi:hypothetical protein
MPLTPLLATNKTEHKQSTPKISDADFKFSLDKFSLDIRKQKNLVRFDAAIKKFKGNALGFFLNFWCRIQGELEVRNHPKTANTNTKTGIFFPRIF